MWAPQNCSLGTFTPLALETLGPNRRVPVQSTVSVEQLTSNSPAGHIYPISLLLVATLECDATFIPFPLCWRQHFNVCNQRKGERPPQQRSVVLAFVGIRSGSRKGASWCGQTCCLTKELLSGLTYGYGFNFTSSYGYVGLSLICIEYRCRWLQICWGTSF